MKQFSSENFKSTLSKFAEISEEFLQMNDSELDHHRICDVFFQLVQAKYCIFNLYDVDGGGFTTVAISGSNAGITRTSDLFGFSLLNRRWPRDIERENLIKDNNITPCTIYDLVGSRLSKNNADLLVKLFDLGSTYIIKISRNNILLCDFMIIMDKNDEFIHHDEAILYTRQLGLLIVQKRTKSLLDQSNTRLADIIEFLPDATFALNSNHQVTIWNKAIEKMTGVSSSDILGKDQYEYALPFYGEQRPHIIDLLVNPNHQYENQYLNFKREVNGVSAEAYAPHLFNGKGAWLYVKASPLHDDLGNVVGAIEIIRDINEQKETEFLIKRSEENFSNLFNRAPLGYQSLDEDGNFIEVNDAWLSTLGYESSNVLGKWFGDFLAENYVEAFKERFPIFKQRGKIHTEFEMKHKNGELRNIAFEGRIGYKSDGSFDKTHCIIQDTTERRRAEDKLIESEQTHKALFDFSGVGIGYYTTDGHVISFNQKAAENMGGTCKDFEGKSIYKLFPKENADFYLSRITKAANSEASEDYEDYVPLATGGLWFFSTFTRILDKHGSVKGVQIISQDISEIKAKEKEITYLSYHDQLTGLYNRRFYDEELIRLNTSRNLPLTIAMGDVNGLKLVNDSFGHKVGDQLLISIANALKKACRQDDIIARLGGDEFAIIFPSTNEEDAGKIIQRILNITSLEKVGPVETSISFGYETMTTMEENIEEIVKKTEDHMYRHKLNESSSIRNKTINLIMNTLFEKNIREMKHSERVSQICVSLTKEMGLDKDAINHIRTVGLMHDIGKIGIDENILNSAKILTNEEWKEIKKHTEIGYRILNSASDFSDIAEDVYAHHERWDGKGYPRGIKEESISIFARIIAVADSYDAMISERPYRAYRKSMSKQDALDEIRKNAGTQFDPKIAQIFVEKALTLDW
jgi:diguanylate cyclase (GGDEF)-like protein/PAS domain S-box-containing protein